MKYTSLRTLRFSSAALLCLAAGGASVRAQSISQYVPQGPSRQTAPDPSAQLGSATHFTNLPSFVPESAGSGDHPVEPYPTNFHYLPFSRVGIGADVSPLGIGIKGALLLNTVFDARLMQNLFTYNSGRFELSNVNVNAQLRLRSTAAAFDWYPFRSVWRCSVGALFLNGNQISADTRIASGTSFKLNGQTFYSANPNPVTGAVPLTGSGVIGIHTHNPALTLSGGFGRYIPRSDRHWSFPSEFGVAFTGAPTVNLNVAGWACLDEAQTQCSDVGDPTNPPAIQFNNAVQTRLAKLRTALNSVRIYPMFSYGVVYSFNIRQLQPRW